MIKKEENKTGLKKGLLRDFLLALLVFGFGSCAGPAKISNQNLAAMYMKDLNFLHPEARLYHLNDSVTRVYYKINTNELLFVRKYEGPEMSASFEASVRVMQSYDSKEVIDSVSVSIPEIGSAAKGVDWTGYLDVKCRMPGSYVLELRVSDMNRRQGARNFYETDKMSDQTRHNWMIYKTDKESIYWSDYLSASDSFMLFHRQKPVKNATVRYYHREFPLPSPPFAVTNEKPFEFAADSLYPYHSQAESADVLEKEGFYHFQKDTSGKVGFTLFRFSEGFPKIGSASDLLGPIRYITTKQEYAELKEQPNTKLAVDNFWIKLAGNPERAREVIRKIYNRVMDANLYYTSFEEGWRTDRGLIFLIYGPPNIVYKRPEGETWIYGEEHNFMSLSFTFMKVANPFSDNDYILSRSPIYKSAWYRAVDAWREGRVYSDN